MRVPDLIGGGPKIYRNSRSGFLGCRLSVNGRRLRLECFGFALILHFSIHLCKPKEGERQIRMVGRESLLISGERPFQEEVGLSELSSRGFKLRQMFKARSHQHMFGTEGFLADGEGALQEWLRFLQAALVRGAGSKGVEHHRQIGMLRTQGLFCDGTRAVQILLCHGRFAQGTADHGEIVQSHHVLGMVRAEDFSRISSARAAIVSARAKSPCFS